MGVSADFIDIIINLESVDKKFPGGKRAFLEKMSSSIGLLCYTDGYLFRDGAMNGSDASAAIKYYLDMGLEGDKKGPNGEIIWSEDIITSNDSLQNSKWVKLEGISYWHVNDKSEFLVHGGNAKKVLKKLLADENL